MSPSPLFFYGLCFLIGISSKIIFHPAYLAALLIVLLVWKGRLISGIVTALAGFILATCSVTLPTLPEEGVQIQGTFVPASISIGQSPFGSSYVMKGSLSTTEWKNVPCQIYTPLHKSRPLGNQSLLVTGKLLPKTFPNYVLKPTSIEPKPSTFSLAEWRFQVKNSLKKQFKSLFSRHETASFLLSMVTGEIDDRLTSLQFNKLGLLHLLGISGFQFSLLALILGAILRIFIPGSKGTLLLISLLTIYAFILGGSPPIQRAWIGSILYAISRMSGYQISPLNALGAALIWELSLNPCVFFELGFQFTFLCTSAIFIVYPPIRDYFKKWLPSRPFNVAKSLPLLDRAVYIFTFFCRETIALNIAIHLVSIPLILFHFHKFPWLSLLYNLLLPPLVSVVYLLLIIGLLVHFPFLKMAELLTTGLLHIASNPPTFFDFQLRAPNFDLSLALLTLTLILLLFYERGRLLDRILRRQPLI